MEPGMIRALWYVVVLIAVIIVFKWYMNRYIAANIQNRLSMADLKAPPMPPASLSKPAMQPVKTASKPVALMSVAPIAAVAKKKSIKKASQKRSTKKKTPAKKAKPAKKAASKKAPAKKIAKSAKKQAKAKTARKKGKK